MIEECTVIEKTLRDISPMISIIIPLFNVEKSIIKTLHSFLAQTFKNFEIVAVDDGSTDDTLEIVWSVLKSSSVSFTLLHQTNKGVSVARNVGMEHAQGRYVLFFDGDDIAHASFLERMVSSFLFSDDIDIVFCGFDRVTKDIKTIKRYADKHKFLTSSCVSGEEVLNLFLKNEIDVWTGAVCYRHSFLKRYNLVYTSGVAYREDFEFQVKALFYARNVSCVAKTLVYYVVHADSITNKQKNWLKGSLHQLRVFLRLSSFFRLQQGNYFENIMCTFFIPHGIISVCEKLVRTNQKKRFKRFVSKKRIRKFLKGTIKINVAFQRVDYVFKAIECLYFPCFFILYNQSKINDTL